MSLYNGDLTEFIDWISRKDTLTNRLFTTDTISGGSIRNLLQNHLKQPFYVYEDVENNKKLLFSSEESKRRYYRAVEAAGGNEKAIEKKYKDLVLLEFDVPAPHKIICVGENDETLKTMNILSGSARQMIKFKVYIDDLTSGLNSPYEVKFKLTGPNGLVTFEDVRNYNTSTTDIQLFDCFDYLQVGSNILTLSIRLTGDVTAEKINPQIPINIIEYNISGKYLNGHDWFDPLSLSDALPIEITINRSISTQVSQTLSCYIDDYAIPKHTTTNNVSGNYAKLNFTIPNEYIKECIYPQSGDEESMHPKHYLLIKGNMSTVDNNINFDSNSLLYEFITQSDEQEELNNHFIIMKTSIPAGQLQTSDGMKGIYLNGIQYEEFTLDWAYFTNGNDTSINVEWSLRRYDATTGDIIDGSQTHISTLSGIKQTTVSPLKFIPDKELPINENWHLIGTVISSQLNENNEYERYEVFDRQIIIEKSSFEFEFDEYPGYYFKLSAYGRSNSESENTRNRWIPTGNITVLPNVPEMVFSPAVPWDSVNGWSNDGLTFNSENCFGTINFNTFDNTYKIADYGRTVEIDFLCGSVNDNDDPLIIIGAKDENNRYDNNNQPRLGPAIYIYPTRAVLYIGNNEIIKTNFKSNERIQLSFIFMPNGSIVDSKYVYIVNNGVLERGAMLDNQDANNGQYGWIKVGGTNSQITLYNLRVWWSNLSVADAFKNYLFDSPNKSSIIIRNSITKGSGSTEIDYDRCVSKIDTILITGDLSKVFEFTENKNDTEIPVNILYTTPTDTQYLGFNATAIKIRKHGQSTLNYPVPSFKIWLNKTKGEGQAQIEFKDPVKNLQLVKNRYPINIGSIPANKFVLQANYADSSCVHNGGLLRLINDTWYNAVFKNSLGVEEYKLRTPPQLFASNQTVQHNDVNLNEVGDSAWIEGYGNTDVTINGLLSSEHTWGELRVAETGNANLTSFPYKIRNAPDSRPAVIFYVNTAQQNSTKKFLGQYVIMDDKKSDHIYGERSIYLWGDGSDPFCMTVEGAETTVNINGKQKRGYDQDEYCVWDNKNVLRVECVLINTPLTSFMDFNVPDEIKIDEDGNTSGDQTFTGTHLATDIRYETDSETGEYKLDPQGNIIPLNYYWEDYFELIFPDEDDINEDDIAENNLNKFSGNYKTVQQSADPNYKWPKDSNNKHLTSKFIRRTQPWVDFLRWICSIGQLNKDSRGNYITNGNVTEAALNKFKAEAHDHLDLYKLAAYYIFYIRFGLVDSVERNAQYKTYDGKHWFLEAWDMDIALGNKNTGGLAFDPPLTRDSLLDATSQTYAYSGRSGSTSNILWDCLEKWDYWVNTILSDTAEALYNGGLTYEKVNDMFDNNYANKWAELIYNESGMYKYVEEAKDKGYLQWLQGSRTSHRHWWISTSMNYYDSKWTCGEFKKARIYMGVDKAKDTPATITIKPTTESYFKFTQKDGTKTIDGIKIANKETPAKWVCDTLSFSAKDPAHLYGALFMESIDLDTFGQGLQVLIFMSAVDPTLGPTIKEFSIGSKIPDNIDNISEFTGWVHKTKPNITSTTEIDALDGLVTYNVTGQLALGNSDIIGNRSKLKNVYAIGTGCISFGSSENGNSFNKVYLPARNIEYNGSTVVNDQICVTSMNLTNSSWNEISFWETSYDPSEVTLKPVLDENGQPQYDPETGEQLFAETTTPATFRKLERIPKEFNSVTFRGSTANNVCSLEFILEWFASIEYYVGLEHQGLSESELEPFILEYIGTNNITAEINNIRWNYGKKKNEHPEYRPITYKDVIRLGYLNGMPNPETGIGVNYGTNSKLKGYVKIEGDPLSPAQLTELTNLFGENVFSLSSINSNLVVDQESTYAQISVSGNIHIENGNLVGSEGKLIKFKCTSFLLSSENVKSYEWLIDGSLGYTFEDAPDGFTRNLILDQTARTEPYDITITATKRGNQSLSANVTITIQPTITAFDFKFSTDSQDVRKFISDERTAKQFFGDYALSNGSLTDTFIIPKGNVSPEFKIDTETPFDATIKEINFKLVSPNNSLPIRESASNYFKADDLASNNGEEYNITTNDIALGELIKITTTANNFINQTIKIVNGNVTGIRNSIKFKLCDEQLFKETCNDMKFLTLICQIRYNSESISQQMYMCNIILYNDNNYILTRTSNAFDPIIRKLRELNNNYYQRVNALYKSDLSVLSGTLEFKDINGNLIDMNGDSGSFVTYNNESIFNYMPSISEINCEGLNYNFASFVLQGNQYFNMNKLKSLTKLSLRNCPNTGMTLLIEDSSTLTELDLSGTCKANLICRNNRALTTIKLGSPSLIEISDCAQLINSEITIDDNSTLNSIDLKSASSENLIMFKLLNKFLPS